MAAATAPQMTLMMMTRVPAFRANASAVRLEAEVELQPTPGPVPVQREARLAAAMEVLPVDLEEQEQHRLEWVEAAIHEEEVPLEALVAVLVLEVTEVQDCLEAAMADLMRTDPADFVVLGERLRDLEGTAVDQRAPE